MMLSLSFSDGGTEARDGREVPPCRANLGLQLGPWAPRVCRQNEAFSYYRTKQADFKALDVFFS